MNNVVIISTKKVIPQVYNIIKYLLSFNAPIKPITPKIIKRIPNANNTQITAVPPLIKSRLGKIKSKCSNKKSRIIKAIPPKKIIMEK